MGTDTFAEETKTQFSWSREHFGLLSGPYLALIIGSFISTNYEKLEVVLCKMNL